MDKAAFVVTSASEWPRGFELGDLPMRDVENRVLLCSPEHFDVVYVINPHMADGEGRPRRIDRSKALRQWSELAETYRRAGLRVDVIDGREGLPDMVFAANQTFPYLDREGTRCVIPSRMANEQRRPEVPWFVEWYRRNGFEVRQLEGVPSDAPFEGMGDALWLPRRAALMVGYGFRTSRAVAEALGRSVGVPTFLFELTSPEFYHLDTAVAPLDEDVALYHPGAFTPRGRELLSRLFKELIESPEDEARHGLACNAHAFSGRRVVIDASCPDTVDLLRRRDFEVSTVDLSEFLASGGSAFCLKMMLP